MRAGKKKQTVGIGNRDLHLGRNTGNQPELADKPLAHQRGKVDGLSHEKKILEKVRDRT